MSSVPGPDDSRPSSAVVLAAGEGIRLRPLTANRPKPMLPAGTRPILEHVLNALINAGVDDIHLVVGYQANRVRSHFGSTYRGVPITYHTQKNQLGSGHALLQARNGPNGSFLLVNGDQIIDHRIVEAVSTAHTDAATLAVVEGRKQSTTVRSTSTARRSRNSSSSRSAGSSACSTPASMRFPSRSSRRSKRSRSNAANSH